MGDSDVDQHSAAEASAHIGKMRKRAWVDEDEDDDQPSFLKESHKQPSWAVSDAQRIAEAQEKGHLTGSHAGGSDDDDDDANHDPESVQQRALANIMRKRFRTEALDSLLSRTEPLLVSKHDRQQRAPPRAVSELPLPRDTAHTVHWHPNGRNVIVGGNRHVYTFHAAGKYVEQLAKLELRDGARLQYSTLLPGGEEVAVAPQESTVPSLLTLASQQWVPLTFLNCRDTAVYENHRRGSSKHDYYISCIAAASSTTHALHRSLLVGSGSTLRIGSLVSGSLTHTVPVDEPICDAALVGAHEIYVAAGSKLHIYDVRRTARFLREIRDEGGQRITAMAVAPVSLGAGQQYVALGSSSGVVNLYQTGNTGVAATTSAAASVAAQRATGESPIKSFKNLTTAIDSISLGKNESGDVFMAFASKQQKAAFRLAELPEGRVVPSFPVQARHHEFPHVVTVAPTVGLLSVGEKQKVTNYFLQ